MELNRDPASRSPEVCPGQVRARNTLLSLSPPRPVSLSFGLLLRSTLIIRRRKPFDRLPMNFALSINISVADTNRCRPLHLVCLPVRPQDEEMTTNRRATLPRLQSTLSSSSRSIATRSHAFGINTAGAHVYWRNPAVSRGAFAAKSNNSPPTINNPFGRHVQKRQPVEIPPLTVPYKYPPALSISSIRLKSHPQTFPATLSPS